MAQTPSTWADYVGNGVENKFQVTFPYQKQQEVFVTVAGAPAAFTFISAGWVQLAAVPANGAAIRVQRSTEAFEPRHEFENGVPLLPRFIDENNKQFLYVVQEAVNETAGVAADALSTAAVAVDIAQAASDKVDAATIDSALMLRQDLANATAPAKGAGLVGFSGGVVSDYIGNHFIVRGSLDPVKAKAAIESALGSHKNLWLTGQFLLDNSSGPGLVISGVDVSITGDAVIEATSDSNDLLRSTGSGFKCSNITLKGPGTYRPDLGGGGEPPALIACRGDRAIVSRTTQINPMGAGVFIRAAQGSKVLFNKITSGYVGSTAQPFLFQVYLRVAADTIVYGNTCVGGIQGICGGGDGSATLSVTDASGGVGSNLVNTLVAGNTCVNQLDHSIYFSNHSTNTKILDNPYLKSEADPIRIEGGPNVVARNTGIGSVGLIGRNVFKTLIEDNHLTSTLSSVNAYGILLYDTVFKRPINDVTIKGNQLTHTGGFSKGGIYVIGEVWDGYQSVISNLKIHDNTIVGHGGTSEGFGIGVFQKLFDGSPVTGALGKNVSIQGNVIEFPAHNVATYGIDLGRGLQGGNVQNNTIVGFRSIGVRLLGVQDFNLSGNTLIADPAATGVYGFFERAKDLTLHYNSQGNRYGQNTYKGTFGRQVLHSDETCFNSDRVIVRSTSAADSDSVLASLWPYMYVFTNMNAGAVITLDTSAASPWPINRDVTIVNAGANSFTVNPGGFAVAAGTSLRLVCTGSNAFIKI